MELLVLVVMMKNWLKMEYVLILIVQFQIVINVQKQEQLLNNVMIVKVDIIYKHQQLLILVLNMMVIVKLLMELNVYYVKRDIR